MVVIFFRCTVFFWLFQSINILKFSEGGRKIITCKDQGWIILRHLKDTRNANSQQISVFIQAIWVRSANGRTKKNNEFIYSSISICTDWCSYRAGSIWITIYRKNMSKLGALREILISWSNNKKNVKIYELFHISVMINLFLIQPMYQYCLTHRYEQVLHTFFSSRFR